MPRLYGNISGGVQVGGYNIPMKITSFSIVNKSGGSITIQCMIMFGSTATAIMPYNKSLATTEAYVVDMTDVLIPAGWFIYVQSSGSADYNFTLE